MRPATIRADHGEIKVCVVSRPGTVPDRGRWVGVAVAAAKRRGLCLRHYGAIWQRPDLRLDDFARDRTKPTQSRKRRPAPAPGVCVVQESEPGGPVGCTEPTHARGLCALHYKRLALHPALFNLIADPPREKSTFRLKKQPREGLCVIVQDDVGCPAAASDVRRLCSYHYGALSGAGLLHELTDQFKGHVYVLERRQDAALVEGFCRLVVNGVACTNVPTRRGVCFRCHNLIQRTGADPEALADPVRVRGNKSPLVRKLSIVKGICVVVEADRPTRSSRRWGS